MKYIILMLLLISSFTAYAAIYMQQDKNGNTTYSDTPLEDSKKVNVPQIINTITATPSSSTAPIGVGAVSSAVSGPAYTKFVISSPTDQQTFQNQRDIPVNVTVEPALMEGDKVQLLLDGQLKGGAAASIHLQLTQVERGQHQISAVIVDKNQQVKQQSSNSVTIFVHLASANFRPSLNQTTPTSNLRLLPIALRILPALLTSGGST